MLAQIATLAGVDLCAGIIEVVVLDEGAELRIPIVVGACDNLPGKVGMICASAGAKAAAGRAEVAVPDGVPRCIRVLLHFYTAKPQRELKHMYLRDAAKLRPDRKK